LQWIIKEAWSEHDLSSHIRENFNAARKWKSAARTIMAANRLRAASTMSSQSSGMPPTPKNDVANSDTDSFYTPERVSTPPPDGVRRSDQAGAHGARMDVESTPEELKAHAEQARQEKAELEDLSKRTNAVEI
jgi:hypothetical protein